MPDDGCRLLALRIIVGLAVVAGAGLLDTGNAAMAQRRAPPWCAYEGGQDGGWDCAYYTFEQCMATARGLGGRCQPNPWALQYPDRPAGRSRRW
jgi:uncharacterized protein DUF3551